MKIVKQEPDSKQCGLCVVAMLTGRGREQILAEFPDYEQTADFAWLNYMRRLGFVLEDPRDDANFDKSLSYGGTVYNGHLQLPLGSRYYCTIVAEPTQPHAVAVDEQGMVFDPSNSAPMDGTCTLGQYVKTNYDKYGNIRIACCYRVRRP